MNYDAKGKTRPQVGSGPLITSAVLVGAGTFLVLTGLAVGSSHLLSVSPAKGEGDGGATERAGETEVCASPSRGGARYGRLAEREPDPGGQRFVTLRPRVAVTG